MLHSFYLQAKKTITDKSLMAGFLMLRLKISVVLTSLHDVLPVELICPVVRLACGDKIALVSATLMNIHYGLG